jgi:hypothetical protein
MGNTPCAWMDECINKTCCTHVRKYYSTLKRNKILIHATTWMNPENSMLIEANQAGKRQIS